MELIVVFANYGMFGASVTMLLNGVLGGDALLNQELLDLFSVVSLQLDDRAPLIIINSGSIAMPLASEGAADFLQVQVLGHALHDGDAITGGSPLEVEMDDVVFVLGGALLALFLRVQTIKGLHGWVDELLLFIGRLVGVTLITIRSSSSDNLLLSWHFL